MRGIRAVDIRTYKDQVKRIHRSARASQSNATLDCVRSLLVDLRRLSEASPRSYYRFS